ncbi:hypothetical protein GGH12_000224 [Coemansia sp. RSA 1822]|nr:hypothetical protein LPJ76_000223 [Coemansia sp. RSA 638]KAJ2545835.1 hypothetical protein GGF49_000038 [Coemansia sp. RSA 1853]KAJ2567786.1 hypothetical protein GGH12_000224 [Coemansia sp. RSA 1822]
MVRNASTRDAEAPDAQHVSLLMESIDRIIGSKHDDPVSPQLNTNNADDYGPFTENRLQRLEENVAKISNTLDQMSQYTAEVHTMTQRHIELSKASYMQNESGTAALKAQYTDLKGTLSVLGKNMMTLAQIVAQRPLSAPGVLDTSRHASMAHSVSGSREPTPTSPFGPTSMAHMSMVPPIATSRPATSIAGDALAHTSFGSQSRGTTPVYVSRQASHLHSPDLVSNYQQQQHQLLMQSRQYQQQLAQQNPQYFQQLSQNMQTYFASAQAKQAQDANDLARRESDRAAAEQLAADEQAQREAEECAKREAEEQARRMAEKQARREAEEVAKRDAEERARREAEEQVKREAVEHIQREARERALRMAEEAFRRNAEELVKFGAEEQAKREAEEANKREAEARAKRVAEEQAKRMAEEQAKRVSEARMKQEAELKAKREAEECAKREANNKAEHAKRVANEKAKIKAEQAKRLANEKAKQNAEQAKRLANEKVKQNAEQAKRAADEQARREYGVRAKGSSASVVAKSEIEQPAQENLVQQHQLDEEARRAKQHQLREKLQQEQRQKSLGKAQSNSIPLPATVLAISQALQDVSHIGTLTPPDSAQIAADADQKPKVPSKPDNSRTTPISPNPAATAKSSVAKTGTAPDPVSASAKQIRSPPVRLQSTSAASKTPEPSAPPRSSMMPVSLVSQVQPPAQSPAKSAADTPLLQPAGPAKQVLSPTKASGMSKADSRWASVIHVAPKVPPRKQAASSMSARSTGTNTGESKSGKPPTPARAIHRPGPRLHRPSPESHRPGHVPVRAPSSPKRPTPPVDSASGIPIVLSASQARNMQMKTTPTNSSTARPPVRPKSKDSFSKQPYRRPSLSPLEPGQVLGTDTDSWQENNSGNSARRSDWHSSKRESGRYESRESSGYDTRVRSPSRSRSRGYRDSSNSSRSSSRHNAANSPAPEVMIKGSTKHRMNDEPNDRYPKRRQVSPRVSNAIMFSDAEDGSDSDSESDYGGVRVRGIALASTTKSHSSSGDVSIVGASKSGAHGSNSNSPMAGVAPRSSGRSSSSDENMVISQTDGRETPTPTELGNGWTTGRVSDSSSNMPNEALRDCLGEMITSERIDRMTGPFVFIGLIAIPPVYHLHFGCRPARPGVKPWELRNTITGLDQFQHWETYNSNSRKPHNRVEYVARAGSSLSMMQRRIKKRLLDTAAVPAPLLSYYLITLGCYPVDKISVSEVEDMFYFVTGKQLRSMHVITERGVGQSSSFVLWRQAKDWVIRLTQFITHTRRAQDVLDTADRMFAQYVEQCRAANSSNDPDSDACIAQKMLTEVNGTLFVGIRSSELKPLYKYLGYMMGDTVGRSDGNYLKELAASFIEVI